MIFAVISDSLSSRLNESPSKKEGKSRNDITLTLPPDSLNESPSKKEGKSGAWLAVESVYGGLNESPSKKEGKL